VKGLKLADSLFSAYIRERDQGCRAYGTNSGPQCSGYLQCAHIISRRYRAVRWDEDNAVTLCAAHHMFWTHRPLEWIVWVNGQNLDYEGLRWRALNDPPEKPQDAIARMRTAA
jgi:hypothetical protein